MDSLYSIISEIFGIEESAIRDEYGPDNIAQWDSLAQFVLISAIETRFRVTFDIEEILTIMTIGDIRLILEQKLGQAIK